MKLITAEMTFLGDLTPKIKHYRIKPSITPFHFKPGQWVDVYVPIPGKNLSGYTVISSNQNTDFFDLAIRESDFHPVTQYIHEKITSTTEVQISPAMGKFFLPEELRQAKLVFIAGGIGITPILSMIRSSPQAVHKLFYSVSNEEDLLFREELSPNAIFCVTKKVSPHWTGETARLSLSLMKKHQVDMDSDFYICGPAQMIDDLKNQLLESGVLREKIHFEKWW